METATQSHTATTTLGGRKRADRDTALQLALIKMAIECHAAELEPLLAGMTTCSTDLMRPGEIQLFDEAELVTRMEGAKKGSVRLLEAELKMAKSLGAIRRLATCPAASALNKLEEHFPHFAEVITLMRQRAALAAVSPGRVFSMPPILLAGMPGVGKTAFSEAVAQCLGVPIRRVDMASATAGFILAGSHSSWSSACPGAVWSLLQTPSAAGLLLVDELDKASEGNYPPIGPLYTLLEPSSARSFKDEYVEVALNASHLMWIATCNDAGAIEPAMRSRFAEFLITAPTESQMPAIAHSVYCARRAQTSWGAAFPERLEEQVANQLKECTPRELAGLIEAAAAHAASCRRTQIRVCDVQAAREAYARRTTPAPQRVGFI